ncbi:MAG: TspO/MBR family protein [Candidatus Beckwithbacteria bacterium]|nr:tryptophan-rich sensory protein [Patescibacteria group bacterium]
MWMVSVLIAQLAGVVGSIFTTSSVNGWFQTINKPTWNPPGWLFGPVWITLYTLMGVASYLVWQKRGLNKNIKIALVVYGVHLVLNVLWSIIFFGLKNPGLAFIEILVLLLFIILTIFLFYKIRPITFWLLLPYLLWTSFASILNFTIWRLNP